MRCPHCRKNIRDEVILEKLGPAKILRKAGSIRGKRGEPSKKGHSTEVARRAARARWEKKS